MTPEEIVSHFPDVQIYEGTTNDGLRITILRGGLGQANPTQYMDNVVSEFVERRGYNEFIERFLDNPWVRVILEGINDIAEEKWISRTSLQ